MLTVPDVLGLWANAPADPIRMQAVACARDDPERLKNDALQVGHLAYRDRP
jgi:hypothetical protein